MPLNGTAVPTAPCDDVHLGAVELFIEGRWGRICNGDFGGDPEEFTLDAQVVCRQLGFPYGTVMDAEQNVDYSDRDYAPADESVVIWATQVRV